LSIWYRGADEANTISSSWLGQQPSAEEQQALRAHCAAWFPVRFETPDEMGAALERCCQDPSRTRLRNLADWLDPSETVRIERRPGDLPLPNVDLADKGPHHEGSRRVAPFLVDWLEARLAETATRRGESREFLFRYDEAGTVSPR
jgi:hypothetical protein